VRQARRLIAERELGGLSRQLRSAVPFLARLNSRSPRTFEQNRALASCQNSVLVPFAHTEIPDPDFPYHSGEKWYEEPGRAFVGLSGESRTADANSPFFRTQVGGGPTTLVSTGEAGDRLFSQLDFPILGVRPARPDSAPVYRPNVPCENQEPPDLNAPGGPPGATQTEAQANGSTSFTRLLDRRRADDYRRLREYSERTRKGLPAVDPMVWGGKGEEMQLKRLGLMRNEKGRIVKRSGR
jgi:hypothetical protein